MNFIQGFNRVFGTRDANGLIQKALTSDNASGGALIREQLERVITNTAVRLSPLVQMLDVKYKKGNFSQFNQLSKLPSPGSAMGESATTPERSSTYTRKSIEKKIMRRKAAVTDFLADTAADDFDAIGQEIEHHIQAKVYDLENYVMYGNAAANQYEHDGFVSVVSSNYSGNESAVVTLKMIDDMIDATRRRQNANHRLGLLMSPEMNSTLSRLQTNVRINLPNSPDQVDAQAGGNRLEFYRKLPIIETAGTRPNPADPDNVMTTVTPSTSATGGTIPDDEYFFRVAPVCYDGEQLAGAEVSQVTAGGNLSTLTLTWTAVPNALRYYIFAGLATGPTNLKLVKIVSAFTYDSAGTITGNNTSHVFTTNPTTAGAEVPAHMADNQPLIEVSSVVEEQIMLIDFDRFQGIGGYDYTNPAGAEIGGLISVEPLAKTDAKRNFLLTTEGCLIPAFEATSAIKRKVRTA